MIVNRHFTLLALLGAPLWLIHLVLPFGAAIAAAYVAILSAAALAQYRRLPDQRRMDVVRRLPGRFSLDCVQTVELDVTNRSGVSLTADVRDELPYALALESGFEPFELPPGRTVRISYRVKAVERGVHTFGDTVVRVSTERALIARQVRFATRETIKVYPRFLGVDQYELLAKMDRWSEVYRRARRFRAPGKEFESLRAYVPGDDVRRVDWKISAKRGEMITRNYQVEKGQQLTLVIDCGRFMAGNIGEYPRLDWAMNAAVMLSHVAQKRGDSVSIACFSNRIEALLPAVKGSAVMPHVLDTLVSVRGRAVESDYWQVFAQVLSSLSRRSLLVVFTDLADPAGASGLIHNLIRAAGMHLVLVVVLSEPAVDAAARSVPRNRDEAYRKAAASYTRIRRFTALEHLRSKGILTLEANPQELSVRVIEKFLQVRRSDLQ